MIRSCSPPARLLNLRTCLLLQLLIWGCLAIKAQPVPKLNSVSPEWIQRGGTIEVSLAGENLTNATRLAFSNDTESNQNSIAASDLKVTNNKALSAKLTIAADSPLGEHEVRVITPTGVSEPVTINLSELPEAQESGTNSSIESSQMLQLPVAVNGLIKASAETDYFRFHAKKGEQLIFEVFASRAGSPLDSS